MVIERLLSTRDRRPTLKLVQALIMLAQLREYNELLLDWLYGHDTITTILEGGGRKISTQAKYREEGGPCRLGVCLVYLQVRRVGC